MCSLLECILLLNKVIERITLDTSSNLWKCKQPYLVYTAYRVRLLLQRFGRILTGDGHNNYFIIIPIILLKLNNEYVQKSQYVILDTWYVQVFIKWLCKEQGKFIWEGYINSVYILLKK